MCVVFARNQATAAVAGLLFAGGFLYMAQQSRLVRHYVLGAFDGRS